MLKQNWKTHSLVLFFNLGIKGAELCPLVRTEIEKYLPVLLTALCRASQLGTNSMLRVTDGLQDEPGDSVVDVSVLLFQVSGLELEYEKGGVGTRLYHLDLLQAEHLSNLVLLLIDDMEPVPGEDDGHRVVLVLLQQTGLHHCRHLRVPHHLPLVLEAGAGQVQDEGWQGVESRSPAPRPSRP